MGVKGYKVFGPDWTCRGFQYEVGKVFKHDGEIKMCGKGFHFCQKASDCFNYYNFDSSNKVAEVEALGLVKTENNKSVTNKIRIVREITWQEVLTIVNTGVSCTGLNNSGNYNAGNYNAGNYNAGNYNAGGFNAGDFNVGSCNTGNCNTGNRNAGDRNTGNRNTGDRNTGDRNTGDFNSGNYNTGDFNTGNNSSGVFCTEKETIKLFNKDSDMTLEDWKRSEARSIIANNMRLTIWISKEDMSDKEKEENPKFKCTGGYLKEFGYKEAWTNLWENITKEEKEIIKGLPNFDKDIFQEITGITNI